MDWKILLAYISGSVDEELLLRNEYLVAENRILRDQITGRVQLSDAERPHPGKGNVLLFRGPRAAGAVDGPIACRERLGGTLKYYERKAA
jgi:hypothetical protein